MSSANPPTYQGQGAHTKPKEPPNPHSCSPLLRLARQRRNLSHVETNSRSARYIFLRGSPGETTLFIQKLGDPLSPSWLTSPSPGKASTKTFFARRKCDYRTTSDRNRLVPVRFLQPRLHYSPNLTTIDIILTHNNNNITFTQCKHYYAYNFYRIMSNINIYTNSSTMLNQPTTPNPLSTYHH